MLRKLKKKIKSLMEERMYRFLMRDVRYLWGRKPFGVKELRYLNEALVSQNLFGIDGKTVPAFEMEFAKTYGVPHAVASTSGTAAIHVALGALDLNPGDEVITAPITDLGTVIPILYQNAVPVFADIDDTYNMDPEDVQRKITDRTKAIVVVHLFGKPCDMDAMVAIAKKHNIPLIEDCAQAHLTEYKGKYVGTIGDIGCFSFQQSKHMTTGDGGMTITSNKAYYDKMKLFVDKGFARKGWGSRAYAFLAPNYRMNGLTAAVGLAQLEKVKSVVEKRNMMGKKLTELLKDAPGLILPKASEDALHSYWLFPLYLKKGDIEVFADEMTKAGFWCGAGYTGKPIYLCSESLTAKKTYGTSQFPFNSSFTAGRSYEYKEGLCPKAEEALRHLVTMPWDESWDEQKVQKAVDTIKKTLKKISSTNDMEERGTTAVEPSVPERATAGSSTQKIRIGIIGCGQMGGWHRKGYQKNPNVELVAFADTDISRAQKFTKQNPANVYTDHRLMFEREKLDGVSICTLPSTHKQIVMDALDNGINVLCEKPLATSVADAEIMTRKAQGKGCLLLSAFKFRFFDEVMEAKRILEKGSLGKIMNFRLMFGGYLDMSDTWYVKKDVSGGGIIMDNGPHAFDLIRYLLGDITEVQAHVSHYQDLEVEDTAQLFCRLEQGGYGTIDISWSMPTPADTYLEIYGEEGALLLDFEGLACKFAIWNEWKRIPNKISVQDAFYRQMDHFAGCIQGKLPSVTGFRDGLESQILIEKAYASLT